MTKRFGTGFTLIEILISMAILAMIVASTFTIFRSSARSWQKGETRSERYHNARVALGKMSAEVSHAVIEDNTPARFIGSGGEVSFISFVSTASGVFELAEIEYWQDEKGRFLIRNEEVDPDYNFSTQEYSDILAEGISELEFSYYDGFVWNSSWDSNLIKQAESDSSEDIDPLPEAVKIRIKVEDKSGKESEEFEVVTRLKLT